MFASRRGTKVFDLIPDDGNKLESEPEGIEPGIVELIQGNQNRK